MLDSCCKISDISALAIALTCLVGALFYKLFDLSTFTVWVVLTIVIFSSLIIVKKYLNVKFKINKFFNINLKYFKSFEFLRLIAILVLLIIETSLLWNSRSSASMVSPWEQVPDIFFPLLALSLSILLYSITKKDKHSLPFIAILFLLLNSVVIFVYSLGFGFDFFIHEATIDLIIKQGSVEPKPLYYLGQYALLVVLNKAFFLPVHYAQLLLVPLLAFVLIPINLYKILLQLFSHKKSILLTLLTVILLPVGIFYNTTPQNLAYLFLTLVIIKTLDKRNRFNTILIFILSLAALSIQPIAGIPALILFLAFLADTNKKFKEDILRILFVLSAIALPMAFSILNYLNGQSFFNYQSTEENSSNISSAIINFFKIQIPHQESALLNSTYLIIFNLNYIAIILCIAGIVISYRNKNLFSKFKKYLYIGSGFLVSALLVSNLSFEYLISYERLDYASRIITVTLLILSPFAFLSIYNGFYRLRSKEKVFRLIMLFSLVPLLLVFVYVNYPRIDNYHNSHGYSTGNEDIETVRWIAQDAQNKKYIVLANQQTSVAALKEFGFNNYHQSKNGEKIFYYPIPTGAALYSYFLDMVNEYPSRETILKAMDLANVDTGYFAISKFWWASPKIINEAKTEADFYKEIANGEIVVFKFVR